MNEAEVIDIGRQAIIVLLQVSLPMLAISLIVGVVIFFVSGYDSNSGTDFDICSEACCYACCFVGAFAIYACFVKDIY